MTYRKDLPWLSPASARKDHSMKPQHAHVLRHAHVHAYAIVENILNAAGCRGEEGMAAPLKGAAIEPKELDGLFCTLGPGTADGHFPPQCRPPGDVPRRSCAPAHSSAADSIDHTRLHVRGAPALAALVRFVKAAA